MIIQFHTPKGVIPIDSDTVTDEELVAINATRQGLEELVSSQPRDLATEVDEIKTRLQQLEVKEAT